MRGPDVIYISGKRVVPSCTNCSSWDRWITCKRHNKRIHPWEWCSEWEYEDHQSAILAIRQARLERERKRRRGL